MSGVGVAAAGLAAAMYIYSRRQNGSCLTHLDGASSYAERFQQHTYAPSTWLEAVYYSAEAIRHVYGETLGTWRTADLLIGLAYLARRSPAGGSSLRDIADAGVPYGLGLSGADSRLAHEHLSLVRHCMAFGLALREIRPEGQLDVLRSLGFAEEDFLVVQQRSWLLKPSYFLLRDRSIGCLVLLIRGTQTIKDMFTSMASASKPHHVVNADGVTLGHTHFGMLAAARYIKAQVLDDLRKHMALNPGMRLQLVGHSMGGGCAAILTMMLRELPEFAETRCVAVACPAVMTKDLASSCSDYVTSIINDTDMIPTMSLAGVDGLRAEVMESTWATDFRQDARSYAVVRAVEGSLVTVGGSLSSVASSTAAATAWTTSRLTRGFRACGNRSSSAGGGGQKRRSLENPRDIDAWLPSRQVARDSQGGETDAEAPASFVYGAISACTGRRRRPQQTARDAQVDADATELSVATPGGMLPLVTPGQVLSTASQAAAFRTDSSTEGWSARRWESVKELTRAWGDSSVSVLTMQHNAATGFLSSVASGPGVAVRYIAQWTPSFDFSRSRHPLSEDPMCQQLSSDESSLGELPQPGGLRGPNNQQRVSTVDAESSTGFRMQSSRSYTPNCEAEYANESGATEPSGILPAAGYLDRAAEHLSRTNSAPAAAPDLVRLGSTLGGDADSTFSPKRTHLTSDESLWSEAADQPPELMHMDQGADFSANTMFENELPCFSDLERSMSAMDAEVARVEATEQLAGERLSSFHGDVPATSQDVQEGQHDAARQREPTNARRLLDSRRTYPAGRILHMVPSKLLFPDAQKSTGLESKSSAPWSFPEASSHSQSDSHPQSDRTGASLAAPLAARLQQVAAQPTGSNSDVQSASGEDAVGTRTPAASDAKSCGIHGMAEERTLKMLPTLREAKEAFDIGTEAALNAAWQASADPEQVDEPYILLDHVPHECYSRMRLCRTMVTSHFTPAYLRSMASAAAAFESGYLAAQ